MPKIGFVSNTDVMDKKKWSGTIFNLYNIISKKYVVDPIVVNTPFADKIFRLQRKIRKMVFKKPTNDMMISYSKKRSKMVDNIMKNSNEKYDLLFAPANSVAMAYMKTEIPIIYLSDATFHSMVDYYFFNLDKKSITNGNCIEQKILDKAKAIIYSSEWAKNDAVEFYKTNPEKIFVLPFGANLVDKFRKKYEPKSEFNLLFVGVDWKRKGADEALDCIKYLSNSIKGTYKLTIIGLQKPDDINFDNVNFVGFLNKNNQDDYEKMIEYYQESDLFILPTHAECSAIVFSEASEYGLPILTYDTGGIQSYVKNGVNGYRLPTSATGKDFAGKVEEICADYETYVKFSKNARKEYEEVLNWDKWLEGFDEAVQKCLIDKSN